MRQLFTEALLISLAGGAAGILGGALLLGRLVEWNPFPTNVPLHPDANVYAVAVVLALLSGILFGAVPVKQVLRSDPYEIVKSSSLGKLGGRITFREVLVALLAEQSSKKDLTRVMVL